MDKRTENIVRYLNNWLDTANEEGLIKTGTDVYAHDAVYFVVHMLVRNVLKTEQIYDMLFSLDYEVANRAYDTILEAYDFANQEEEKIKEATEEVNGIEKDSENDSN